MREKKGKERRVIREVEGRGEGKRREWERGDKKPDWLLLGLLSYGYPTKK